MFTFLCLIKLTAIFMIKHFFYTFGKISILNLENLTTNFWKFNFWNFENLKIHSTFLIFSLQHNQQWTVIKYHRVHSFVRITGNHCMKAVPVHRHPRLLPHRHVTVSERTKELTQTWMMKTCQRMMTRFTIRSWISEEYLNHAQKL